MTRSEFILELAAKLEGMPENERQDALQYYEEYFDDAGPENEQAVIAELKSPAAVAARIWAGNGGKTPSAPSSAQEAEASPPKERPSAVFWVLLCLLSPIWGSLLITAAAVLLALAVTLGALLISGLLCVVVGLCHLLSDPLNGVYTFSIGLAAIGLTIMTVPGVLWLVQKGIPALPRGVRRIWDSAVRFAHQ